jgi:hypothetical protein
MILGQHLQKHAPLILERGSVSFDHHPVREQGIAGCDWMRFPLDFDQAHATTADRFQSFIVAERGNIDTKIAARFQNRNTWLKVMNFSVNDSFRQFRSFSLC